MPSVTFYVIQQSQLPDQLFTACRLVEKIFREGRQVYIHTTDEAISRQVDDLLWEFRPDSFLPHKIEGVPVDEAVPIVIGHGQDYAGPFDVMVNLATSIPAFHGRFPRIAEIVRNEESAKAVSREHWQFYRQQGYEVDKHDL